MTLDIYYKGTKITSFDSNDKIEDLIYYYEALSDDELKDIDIKVSENKNFIKESIVQDNDHEYTIWSSADFAEADEQIPLVKVFVEDDGSLRAEAVGDSAFDLESLKTASNSLKSTEGRPLKDRLLRIDKSLNHSDPNLSVEVQRNLIRATRGQDKKSIRDLLGGVDPSTIPDPDPKDKEHYPRNVELPAGYKENRDLHPFGVQAIASQVLIGIRDELKAAANLTSANENSLAILFTELTGVNYYDLSVFDEEQYQYILDILGRSSDKFDETYLEPKDNKYITNLRKLVDELIKKVNLKKNPNFYDAESADKNLDDIKQQLKTFSEKDNVDEDAVVDQFEDVTGVNYYTETVTDNNKYFKFLNQVGLASNIGPKDNEFISELKDYTEDLIEEVLLREDPDFYKYNAQ